MDCWQIRRALWDKKITQKSIASRLGVHPSLISLVITRRGVSFRVQNAIAKALQIPFDQIWDEQPAS